MTTALLLATETLNPRAPELRLSTARPGADDDFARRLASATTTRETARERESSRLADDDDADRNAPSGGAADETADSGRDADTEVASVSSERSTSPDERQTAEPDADSSNEAPDATGEDTPGTAQDGAVDALLTQTTVVANGSLDVAPVNQVVDDQSAAAATVAATAREGDADAIGARATRLSAEPAAGTGAERSAVATESAAVPTDVHQESGDPGSRDGQRAADQIGRLLDEGAIDPARHDTSPDTRADVTRSIPTPGDRADRPGRQGEPTRGNANEIANRVTNPTATEVVAQTPTVESTPDAAPGRTGEQVVPAAVRAVQVDASVQLENTSAQLGGPTVRVAGSSTVLGSSVAAPAGSAETPGVTPSTPETPELPSRILRGLSAMVNQRGGILNMRLDPPDLGAMRVQMSILRGSVVAQFTASTAQAHALLEGNLGVLRTALEGQGLAVDRLSVQLQPSADGQSSGRQESTGQDSSADRRHDAGGGESRGRRDADREAHRDRGFADDLGLISTPANEPAVEGASS